MPGDRVATGLTSVRLELPQLLHLRAVAQGLPVVEAARRYLGCSIEQPRVLATPDKAADLA